MKNPYSLSNLQRLFLLLSFSTLGLSEAAAQLTVTPPTPGTLAAQATEMAQFLAGPGVVITNPQIIGAPGAYGFFNAANTNLGLPQGVMLTSGSINNAVGPNNTGASTANNSGPGDLMLNAISPAGQQTFDATVLEFDVEVTTSSFMFEYVFASEEYPEFACSINDIFAFFVSGSGVTGNVPGFPGERNIAVLPNSNTVVSINNINSAPCGAANVQYYVDNGTGMTPTVNTAIQYDGFTSVLVAEIAGLVPGSVYHLRMAIADMSDGAWDSGVFIKKGSLRSCNTPDCNPTAAPVTQFPAGIKANLFPNPAKEQAQLVISGLPVGVQELNVSVTDMLGRQVASTSQSPTATGEAIITLGTSRLAPGMYQYLMRSAEGHPLATGKFTVSE